MHAIDARMTAQEIWVLCIIYNNKASCAAPPAVCLNHDLNGHLIKTREGSLFLDPAQATNATFLPHCLVLCGASAQPQ